MTDEPDTSQGTEDLDGSTTEVHNTLSPHDVPKDSPNRREVEERVREEGGEATRGDAA